MNHQNRYEYIQSSPARTGTRYEYVQQSTPQKPSGRPVQPTNSLRPGTNPIATQKLHELLSTPKKVKVIVIFFDQNYQTFMFFLHRWFHHVLQEEWRLLHFPQSLKTPSKPLAIHLNARPDRPSTPKHSKNLITRLVPSNWPPRRNRPTPP